MTYFFIFVRKSLLFHNVAEQNIDQAVKSHYRKTSVLPQNKSKLAKNEYSDNSCNGCKSRNWKRQWTAMAFAC